MTHERRDTRLSAEDRAWIKEQVAKAPPISPAVRAAIIRILSNPGGAK